MCRRSGSRRAGNAGRSARAGRRWRPGSPIGAAPTGTSSRPTSSPRDHATGRGASRCTARRRARRGARGRVRPRARAPGPRARPRPRRGAPADGRVAAAGRTAAHRGLRRRPAAARVPGGERPRRGAREPDPRRLRRPARAARRRSRVRAQAAGTPARARSRGRRRRRLLPGGAGGGRRARRGERRCRSATGSWPRGTRPGRRWSVTWPRWRRGGWTSPCRRSCRPGAAAPGSRSGRLTHAQQSNADQQMSLRNRWSSSTSSRMASGSWSRCHRHSSCPASSPSPSGAPARAALIA